MEFVEPFLCHLCGKIFYKLSTFESHMKWKHMEKTNEFMCDQCGRIFQKKYNLQKHIKSGVHFISETVKCAVCDFRALNRKMMAEHYHNVHFVTLKESSICFKTLEEFYSWKSDFEHKTNSRFVKMSSSRQRKNGFIRSTFFCHRDGNFIPKGRNLRHLKVKSSNKINAHCPAKIDVEISERIVIANYIDTHLGHDLGIHRQYLEPIDKSVIAEKIAHEVPFDQILEELNNSITISNVKGLNLLTRKDLWSIVDSFKVNKKSSVRKKAKSRRKIKTEPVLLKLFDEGTNSLLETNANDERYFKSYDTTNKKNNVIVCPKNNDTTNEENDNIIVYPVIFKDDNAQYFQEYGLISGKNNENNGCLIINSQGEIETINGHHVICIKNGELQIYEALHENDMLQECENNIMSFTQNHRHDIGKISVLGTVDAVYKNEDQVPSGQIAPKKVETSHTYLVKNDETTVSSVNTNYKRAVYLNKTKNRLINYDQRKLLSSNNISIENHPEYEISISNLERDEDISEYVIIGDNGNTDEKCFISTDECKDNTISHIDLPIEEITLSTLKTEPNEESEIKEELEDNFIVNERRCATLCNSDSPECNGKRKGVMYKLLNVHNMINNEEQLNIFSNISSLENSLKSLSKNNEQKPVVSETEYFEVKHLEYYDPR